MKLYQKDDKRRLYQLINLYLTGEIDENTFCDEFYYSYDLEIGAETLNDVERKAFNELSVITDRFSSFESDFKLAPGAYTNKAELRVATVKTKEILYKYANH